MVKSFVTSDSVEDRLQWVIDPERVKPLMMKYYGGNEIDAEGYRSFDRSEISHRGTFVTSVVRTGDFLAYPIAVSRVVSGDSVRYLVDWESWVGYCDITPEKAKVEKPTEPFMMRVMLRPESYFNYSFSDDSKWHAYQMHFRNSDEVFLAYSAIKSAPDEALQVVRDNGGTTPFLVKVRFPQGARAGNQVEIVEVIEVGWIAGINEEKND